MKIDAELEDLNEALLQMSSQDLENLKKALDYYFNQSVCEVNDDEIDQNVLKFYFMNVHMQEILRK